MDNSGSSIAPGERALNYLGAKRLEECLHGLKCRRVVEERAEQLHIKVREKRAPLRDLVALLPQNMNLNRILPAPDFTDAESSINFELVYPAAGPHDFYRQVGCVPRLVANEIALVGLQAGLLRSLSQCPRTVWRKVDVLL